MAVRKSTLGQKWGQKWASRIAKRLRLYPKAYSRSMRDLAWAFGSSAPRTSGTMLSKPLPERYRIIEEVGQGGMAVVYRAHDQKLRREVAVKVLHAHLLAEPESKARLEREACA